MKVLYALVLVLTAFAASAQTLDITAIPAGDDDDWVAAWTAEPIDEIQTLEATMRARIASSEPTIAHFDDLVSEVDEVAITGSNAAKGVPEGSIQPGGETQAMPVQVLASEPITSKLDEVIDEVIDEAIEEIDGIANEQVLPPHD